MTQPRILIAGIGNVFLGDDAFGVEVVRRLQQQQLPESVRTVDFGIRGFDLACAMMAGCEAVILVDAMPRGGPPGTLYVLETDRESVVADEAESLIEGHSLTPARVLQWIAVLNGRMPQLRVLGCEPASFGSFEQPQTELSPAVAAAVDRALPLIRSLIDELTSVTRE